MCDIGMIVNISNGRFLSITAEYMVHCIGHGASKSFREWTTRSTRNVYWPHEFLLITAWKYRLLDTPKLLISFAVTQILIYLYPTAVISYTAVAVGTLSGPVGLLVWFSS